MAKRKTKLERSIEAELQLEAAVLQQHDEEHLSDAKDKDITEDTATTNNVENKVEDEIFYDKVPHTYIRRLRKL